MTTNTEKPVGPGTFNRDRYSVTIAEDGKILVKKDDWLSKYSWVVLWRRRHARCFRSRESRPFLPNQEIKGIKEIDDVDLIKTGEYLIHEPTYFYWMKNAASRFPKKPVKPTKPENIRSTNWTAANLGGLDGMYFLGSGGAVLLAFRNLDTGTVYYYVLFRAGFGVGLDFGNIIKAIKKFIRALGAAFLAKKAATAKFEPVVTIPCVQRTKRRKFGHSMSRLEGGHGRSETKLLIRKNYRLYASIRLFPRNFHRN